MFGNKEVSFSAFSTDLPPNLDIFLQLDAHERLPNSKTLSFSVCLGINCTLTQKRFINWMRTNGSRIAEPYRFLVFWGLFAPNPPIASSAGCAQAGPEQQTPSVFCIFEECLLPIAYCLLPIACCLWPIASCLLPTAYC